MLFTKQNNGGNFYLHDQHFIIFALLFLMIIKGTDEKNKSKTIIIHPGVGF
jgi:hypothetical protein